MQKSFNSLWRWYAKQELNEEDFQYFVKDIFNFIEQRDNASLHLLNLELEVLGWGIQVMDEAAYQDLLALQQNRHHINLKAHLGNQH